MFLHKPSAPFSPALPIKGVEVLKCSFCSVKDMTVIFYIVCLGYVQENDGGMCNILLNNFREDKNHFKGAEVINKLNSKYNKGMCACGCLYSHCCFYVLTCFRVQVHLVFPDSSCCF